MRKILGIVLTLMIIGILLIGVKDLPAFGDVHHPAYNEVAKEYVKNGTKNTGALNVLTAIILDYRAFDTFVEATVLFTGAIVVMVVLKKEKR